MPAIPSKIAQIQRASAGHHNRPRYRIALSTPKPTGQSHSRWDRSTTVGIIKLPTTPILAVVANSRPASVEPTPASRKNCGSPPTCAHTWVGCNPNTAVLAHAAGERYIFLVAL